MSLIMSVAIGPGCTELARMFSLACCMAVALVNSRTAPLVAVYARVRPGLQRRASAGGGRMDDGAPAGRWHGRERAVGAEEAALDVDGHDAVPVLLAHLLDLRPQQDAGVVDEDVELAVSLERRGHRRPPVGLPRH